MLTSVPMIEQVWDSVGPWLKGVLIAAVFAVLLAKSVKYVNQGELGLRHLRGRVKMTAKPITPGWALHVPFVGGVFKKSVLPQTWPLGGVLVPKGGRTWDANYSITFVIDAERVWHSWFGHQDPDEYLRTTCTSFLWQALQASEVSPDRVDHGEVGREVIEPAGKALELVGVTLLELHHRWTAETDASQLGTAIRDTGPGIGVTAAAIKALNGHNGQDAGQDAVLEPAAED